jgi:hypothetical protein
MSRCQTDCADTDCYHPRRPEAHTTPARRRHRCGTTGTISTVNTTGHHSNTRLEEASQHVQLDLGAGTAEDEVVEDVTTGGVVVWIAFARRQL